MIYDEERRKAIAEGKQRADAVRFEQEVEPIPERARCSRCKQWKSVPDEISLRAYVTKCQVTRYYPRDKCKQCDREATAVYRERMLREDPDGYKARMRAAASRHNHKRRANTPTPVDPEPFAEWLAEFYNRTAGLERLVENVGPSGGSRYERVYPVSGLSEVVGKDRHWAEDLIRGRRRNVSIEDVDAVLTFVGEQYMLHILYPGI